MGDPQTQNSEDTLSHLYKAHTALAHVIVQVDGLVLKAHKMSAQGQIVGLDLRGFAHFLESTASSLQEWIPRFEDPTGRFHMQGQRHEQIGDSMSFQADRKVGDGERTASQDKVWSCTKSENKLDVPFNVDDIASSKKKSRVLSDSPLVPWPERVQFFVLTPMAACKREFSPRILHTSSLKEQEILQAFSLSAITSPTESCTHAQPLEGAPVPSLLLHKPSSEVERVAESEPNMSSPSHQQRFENQGILPDMLVTPLPPPRSLVKRYSRFFEAEEELAGSPSRLLVTPTVKRNASCHKPAAEEDDAEGTEYFTAFSQQRSIASSVSTSGRNYCSLPSEASTPHTCHGGPSSSAENSTPLPPQTSLIKRYSQFLHSGENNETTADMKMMLSPLLISSLPKTCVLIQPHFEEDSVKRRFSLQTPVLRSPFKTPGFFLRTANDLECDEDMDLTSLKKPWQPPRPPPSVKRTPSSDMQFTRVGRAPASNKRLPLVDVQVSTVRKLGVPLPGEQTLKRELWCRMEAEFTSISNVCKSLFTDNQAEEAQASAEAGAQKSGMENKENRFVPRGLQQRGSNLYI